MTNLAKAAIAGAVMAKSATKRRAHATERRWSLTDLVTPLLTSRLGKQAVPRAREKKSTANSASLKLPNGSRKGLVTGSGAAPGRGDAEMSGATGVSPVVISALCSDDSVSP